MVAGDRAQGKENGNVHHAATAEKLDFGNPTEVEALSTVRNTQAVTPRDENTLRHFYGVCVPHGETTTGCMATLKAPDSHSWKSSE